MTIDPVVGCVVCAVVALCLAAFALSGKRGRW
jgi:hypothetical protein